MPFDLKAFLKELKEAGSLSDDQVQNLSTIFASEAAQTYLEKNQLRQSDYSRKTQELSETRKSYDKAIEQSGQLSQIIEDMKKRPDTSANELQQAKQQLALMQANVARIYNDLYAYDEVKDSFNAVGWDKPEKIFNFPSSASGNGTGNGNGNPSASGSGYVPNPQAGGNGNGNPAFDEAALLKKIEAQMLARFNPYFQQLAEWPITFQSMQEKYHDLTGKRLNLNDLKRTLAEKMTELKIDDPLQAFNAAYGISDLEKEKEFAERIAIKEKEWKEASQAELKRSLLSKNGQGTADPNSEFYKLMHS